MEFTWWLILCSAGAYILGSIPTSVWTGKWFFNLDIRERGSGNAGASNTFRVLGRIPGIFVLLIDTLKGFIAASLIYWFAADLTDNPIPWQLLTGVIAVIGHLFPVFAGFRGGKGVATLLGLALAIHPFSALLAFAVFAVLLLSTGYVAVGSMGGAISYPLILLLWFSPDFYLLLFALSMAVLIVFTHKSNIKRLIKGTEGKSITFQKK